MKKNDFQDLLGSIKEAGEIMKGRKKPSRVFKFDPIQVKKIRTKLKVFQTKFASIFGISVGTLRNWEQGRTCPGGAARVLLKIAAKRPKAVLEALYN
jgi:putative transcriptional regulator